MRVEDASPLDLFAQGIKSGETLDKYTRTLRRITCNILEDVLEGSFEERVQQMVTMGRNDPKWMRDLLLNLSKKLRERTELPEDHPDYLNPDSIANYFKPIKKLFDMNDVAIQWKRIYATYPERDNMPESRGWTREEISLMLKHAHGPLDRALVLVLASSGMRAGGLALIWEDLTPIYRTGDGDLTLDPGPDDTVACAVLRVYRGSPERYLALITPEAFDALQVYGHTWKKLRGSMPRPKDPVFLVQTGANKNASTKILRDRVIRMAAKAGLRGSKQGKRFEVPVMNGFRRFWNKTCKEAASGESALASLIKKEYMMGHRGLVALDQNYFKTNVMELATEYVKVVPDLTIDDSERLKQSNRRMARNIQAMEDKKDSKIGRLEAEIGRLEAEREAGAARLEREIRRMEAEKDSKIERLEGHIRRMEEKMSGVDGGGASLADDILNSLLKSQKSGEVSSDVAESLTAMMRRMGELQEEAINKIKAEYDARLDGLLRSMGRGHLDAPAEDPPVRFRNDDGV